MAEWVRIGHSLNEAEKQYVTSRRDTVQQCLKKNGIPCTLEEVPNIAVIASGGGERAMVALLGSLLQLGKEGLLDSMMYLAGVSGSTWCMASLYQELNWSSKSSVTDAIVTRLGSGSLPWEEMKAQLKKYYSEDYSNYSLTHFYSAMIVPFIVKEIDENVLSAQRGRDSSDPYPIYTMIDKTVNQQDAKNNTVSENVWFEMTPSEAGYSLAGAFVDQAHFGSEFSEGTEIKPQPEIDMSYVQGVCGSALASQQQVLDHIKNFFQHLECICHGCKVLHTLVDLHIQALKEDGKYPELHAQTLNKLLEGKLDKTGNEVVLDPNNKTLEKAGWMAKLKAHILHVCECFSDWAKDWSKDCSLRATDWWDISISTIECVVLWKWGTTYNFLHGMSEAKNLNLDTKTRDYEDAGLLLNSPYFAVLRKDRNIDLIISLDFSSGNPEMTLEEASRMSKSMGIRFPHVRLPCNAAGSPDPYYVCPGDGKIPTVIHMPLFNMKNCDGSHQVLEDNRKKYGTFQLPYSPEMISDLMKMAQMNVTLAKDTLLREMKKAKNRRSQ